MDEALVSLVLSRERERERERARESDVKEKTKPWEEEEEEEEGGEEERKKRRKKEREGEVGHRKLSAMGENLSHEPLSFVFFSLFTMSNYDVCYR